MGTGDWAITGAGGQIGHVLRPGLRDRVEKLRLLDVTRLETGHSSESAHVVDVRSLGALTEALTGADGVIHLAAIADEADFRALLDLNIAGTYNVLEAARLNGVKRVVLASTNHVTGMYPADTPVSIYSPVRPDSHYAVTKVTTEALGRLYADKFGLEVACLRIGSCLSRPVQPRHRHTWLSHPDAVAAFHVAMTVPDLTFAVFYAVSANGETWWDLAPGHALGYLPTSDARADAELQCGPAYAGLQGGEFAAPAYTLRAQREARPDP